MVFNFSLKNRNFISNVCLPAITLVFFLPWFLLHRRCFITPASRYITSASCYHPRYQSRFSMYTRGLIPRNFAKLARGSSDWTELMHIFSPVRLTKSLPAPSPSWPIQVFRTIVTGLFLVISATTRSSAHDIPSIIQYNHDRVDTNIISIVPHPTSQQGRVSPSFKTVIILKMYNSRQCPDPTSASNSVPKSLAIFRTVMK